MADAEPTARQEIEFTLTSHRRGKVRIKILDRINVDDVYLHQVNGHVYRLLTGDDPGDEVNKIFKDALLKEQFVVGER